MARKKWITKACLFITVVGVSAFAIASDDYYPVELEARSGIDLQTYSEKTTISAGSLATDYQALVPSAKTTIKLFFSPQTFLQFSGMGTLYSQANNETWTVNGTKVQDNNLSATRTSFSLQLGQRLAKKHDFTFGVGFDQNKFTRSQFDMTNYGETVFPNKNSDDGSYSPTDRSALLSATVKEELLAVNLVGSYALSNFFIDNSSGLRYKVSAQFATPMYFRVTNINGGNYTTLTSQFDGFDLHTSAMLGWQFNRQWLLHAGLHTYYEKRNKILSANAQLPNSELLGAEAQVGFSTRF